MESEVKNRSCVPKEVKRGYMLCYGNERERISKEQARSEWTTLSGHRRQKTEQQQGMTHVNIRSHSLGSLIYKVQKKQRKKYLNGLKTTFLMNTQDVISKQKLPRDRGFYGVNVYSTRWNHSEGMKKSMNKSEASHPTHTSRSQNRNSTSIYLHMNGR